MSDTDNTTQWLIALRTSWQHKFRQASIASRCSPAASSSSRSSWRWRRSARCQIPQLAVSMTDVPDWMEPMVKHWKCPRSSKGANNTQDKSARKALVLWKPALQFNAITAAGVWRSRCRIPRALELENTWDESTCLSLTPFTLELMIHESSRARHWLLDDTAQSAEMLLRWPQCYRLRFLNFSGCNLTWRLIDWLSDFKGHLDHRVFGQKSSKIVKLHLRINAVWQGFDRVEDRLPSPSYLHPESLVALVSSQVCGPSN